MAEYSSWYSCWQSEVEALNLPDIRIKRGEECDFMAFNLNAWRLEGPDPTDFFRGHNYAIAHHKSGRTIHISIPPYAYEGTPPRRLVCHFW